MLTWVMSAANSSSISDQRNVGDHEVRRQVSSGATVSQDFNVRITDSQMIFESHQLLFDKIIPKLPASASLLAKIKV